MVTKRLKKKKKRKGGKSRKKVTVDNPTANTAGADRSSYHRSLGQCTRVAVLGHVTKSRLQQKAANFFLEDQPLAFDKYHYLGLTNLRSGSLYANDERFREMADFVSGYVDASEDEQGVLTREHGRGGRKLDTLKNLELRFTWLLGGYLASCERLDEPATQDKRVFELHAWFKKICAMYGISFAISHDNVESKTDEAINVLGACTLEPFDFGVHAGKANAVWGEEKVNDFISTIYGMLALDHMAADLPENAHEEWDKDHITEYIPQIFEKFFGLKSLAMTNMQRFCLGVLKALQQMADDLAKEEQELSNNPRPAPNTPASSSFQQGIYLPRCPTKTSIQSADRIYMFAILTGAIEWYGNDPDRVGLHPDTCELFLLKLLVPCVPSTKTVESYLSSGRGATVTDAANMQKVIRKACESWLPLEHLVPLHEQIWAIRTNAKGDGAASRRYSSSSSNESVSSFADSTDSKVDKVAKRKALYRRSSMTNWSGIKNEHIISLDQALRVVMEEWFEHAERQKQLAREKATAKTLPLEGGSLALGHSQSQTAVESQHRDALEAARAARQQAAACDEATRDAGTAARPKSAGMLRSSGNDIQLNTSGNKWRAWGQKAIETGSRSPNNSSTARPSPQPRKGSMHDLAEVWEHWILPDYSTFAEQKRQENTQLRRKLRQHQQPRRSSHTSSPTPTKTSMNSKPRAIDMTSRRQQNSPLEKFKDPRTVPVLRVLQTKQRTKKLQRKQTCTVQKVKSREISSLTRDNANSWGSRWTQYEIKSQPVPTKPFMCTKLHLTAAQQRDKQDRELREERENDIAFQLWRHGINNTKYEQRRAEQLRQWEKKTSEAVDLLQQREYEKAESTLLLEKLNAVGFSTNSPLVPDNASTNISLNKVWATAQQTERERNQRDAAKEKQDAWEAIFGDKPGTMVHQKKGVAREAYSSIRAPVFCTGSNVRLLEREPDLRVNPAGSRDLPRGMPRFCTTRWSLIED